MSETSEVEIRLVLTNPERWTSWSQRISGPGRVRVNLPSGTQIGDKLEGYVGKHKWFDVITDKEEVWMVVDSRAFKSALEAQDICDRPVADLVMERSTDGDRSKLEWATDLTKPKATAGFDCQWGEEFETW